MTGFRQKLIRFMQGRYLMYGYDTLTRFLSVVWLVLMFASSITRIRALSFLHLALFIYIYFRLFSRNITARYKENEAFKKFASGFLGKFSGLKSNIQMHSRYHVYRCPGCSQKIRIPRGKGRIEVTCPKCGDRFLKVS